MFWFASSSAKPGLNIFELLYLIFHKLSYLKKCQKFNLLEILKKYILKAVLICQIPIELYWKSQIYIMLVPYFPN